MTSEERKEAFAKAYNALIVKFGVGLKPIIQSEILGDAVLSKPAMVSVLVDDWQPPNPEDKP